MKEKNFKLTYPHDLYLLWKRGRLHYKWFQEYRSIFDEDDLRIVRNQHLDGKHFGEWFTAIHYAEKGYAVLVEKYMYGGRSGIHARKRGCIREMLGEGALKKLRKWKVQYHSQPPDLFVFNGKDYFFVEVKRDRDLLRECQRAYFKKIETTFRRGVVIVDLQPMP